MKSIIAENALIETYNKKFVKGTKYYFIALKLRQRKGFSKYKIAKLLKIKESLVGEWIYRNSVPFPIRCIEFCKRKKWLPSHPSQELARIVGYNIGDGHVKKDLGKVYFYGKNGMPELNNFIKKNFSIKGTIRPNRNGVQTLEIGNASFTRLLFCAGCPKGDKTKQIFQIPDWIMNPENYGCSENEAKEIQKSFIQSLNDSETTKFGRKNHENWLGEIKFEIYTYRFPMQMQFIKQLGKIFRKFEINPIEFHYFRRDRNCYRIGLRIKETTNIINFFINVGFYFNKRRLSISLMNLERFCTLRLNKIDLYDIAIKLRESNWTYEEISRCLNLPPGTIRGWVSRGRKPLSYNNRKILTNFQNSKT